MLVNMRLSVSFASLHSECTISGKKGPRTAGSMKARDRIQVRDLRDLVLRKIHSFELVKWSKVF